MTYHQRPQLQKSVEKTWNLLNNGSSAGSLLQTVTTENWYDADNNATRIKVTTTGDGHTYSKDTNNHYGPDAWDRARGRRRGRSR